MAEELLNKKDEPVIPDVPDTPPAPDQPGTDEPVIDTNDKQAIKNLIDEITKKLSELSELLAQ